MRRFISLKSLGIMCMAGFLAAAPGAFAQDDFDFGDMGGDAPAEESSGEEQQEDVSNADKPESDVIETLCQKMSHEGDEKYPYRLMQEGKKWVAVVSKPKKDPFRPIVEKKVVLAPVRKVQEVKQVEKAKPAAPPVKPIKLFVSGIVGNEGSRLAIVKFENEEMTISKDQIVEGKFKVVDIYADRVVVYSNKEQRRHTFKIGGDEKAAD